MVLIGSRKLKKLSATGHYSHLLFWSSECGTASERLCCQHRWHHHTRHHAQSACWPLVT